MPKLGMQPIRRRQLIQATMEAIDEVGLADTTVMRIAKRAGVSAGIISHYFGGKDGLLEATMRQILGDLGNAVTSRRMALPEDTPQAHIRAIIDGFHGGLDKLASAYRLHAEFWHRAVSCTGMP